MKRASIEVGTNSIRMLIAEINDGKVNVIKKELITSRLGDGIKNDKLDQAALSKGIEDLSKFKSVIDQYQIEDVKVVGTSVLRDVKNSSEFVKRVKDELDFEMDIISGMKEAELIFKGVNLGFELNTFIIFDIGGGSTEFIWKSLKDKEINIKSIDIGAVRLSNKFISDRDSFMGKRLIDKISLHVKEKLNEELNLTLKINNLIGVGGTISSLASIMLKLEKYDSEALHNYILKYTDVNKILNVLRKLDLKTRKKIKGLDKDRADIIIPGIVILLEVMKHLRSLKLRVSDYDILYGLLE